MDVTDELAWLDVLRRVLDRAHLWQPDQIAQTVAATTARVDITSTIYLVDQEQRALRAVPSPDRPTPPALPVDSSVAGRAFALVRSITVGDDDGLARWWVPMVDGTDRMGVMEFVSPAVGDADTETLRERLELLAGLVGHLITTCTPRGDFLHQVRRSQPMSVASELLWQVLQPLTASCDQLTISAILQPCYAIGGDGYDYAIDGPLARLAVFDAVGRGLDAGLRTTVAVSAIRAARRDGQGLYAQARAADLALVEQFSDTRFVTAFLGELQMDTGAFRFVNAGHPAPVLMRAGKAVRQVTGGRRLPLGLDDASIEVGEAALEPGDRLLLYTDGITEARDAAGDLFGLPRLVELAERHTAAGLAAPETLRRLSHAVMEHQGGPPADDATLLLAEWSPVAALRTVP